MPETKYKDGQEALLVPGIMGAVKGGKLILAIELKTEGVESKSGKSIVIASTRGNIGIPGTDLKLGVNLYRPV